MEFIKRTITSFKQIFRRRPRITIAIVVVLALALPFIINQVLQQQNLRQRASTAPPIKIWIKPLSTTASPYQVGMVGNTVDVSVLANAPEGVDVGAVHFKLVYDTSLWSQPTVVPSEPSLQIVQTKFSNIQTKGYVEMTLVNPTITQFTGEVRIVTLRFTSIAAGTGEIGIVPSNIQVTASLYDTYVPIANTENITGSFVIGSLLSPTPSPASCVAPTGMLPNGCSCTTDDQCGGKKCKPTGSDGSGVCADYLSPFPSNMPTVSPTPTPSYPLTPTPTLTPGCIRTENGVVCPTPSPILTPTPTPIPTVGPTATAVPTQSVPANDTVIQLVLTLPGIGKLNGDNPTPKRGTRNVTVLALNNANVQVAEAKGVLSYIGENGTYWGQVSFGTQIPPGAYLIKVKFDNTLYKQLPGIITLTAAPVQSNTPKTRLVTGDINQDNKLSVEDYNLFLACFQGAPACSESIGILADLNDNGSAKKDFDDMNILQRGFATREGD